MSVLIKGMEIPVSCGECLNIGWNYVFECNLDDVEEGEKLITCPLIPVPPHGDLIERDALMQHKVFLPMAGGLMPIVYASYVRNAPTIIEAEEK